MTQATDQVTPEAIAADRGSRKSPERPALPLGASPDGKGSKAADAKAKEIKSPGIDSQGLVPTEPAELAGLRESFAQIYRGKDALRQEYELLQEAQRLGLEVEAYRRLYTLHLQQSRGRRESGGWSRRLSSLMECAVALSLTIALVQYVSESPNRIKQAELQAWNVVNSARGQRTNGGRVIAIQELAKTGGSLAGLNLEKAALPQLRLPKTRLDGANFRQTSLVGADFRESHLKNADLTQADLRGANFQGAHLENTKFPEAKLFLAQLQKADLSAANLFGAVLQGANLQEARLGYPGLKSVRTNLEKADLSMANLRAAELFGANLRRANLRGANFRQADLRSADLRGANPPMPKVAPKPVTKGDAKTAATANPDGTAQVALGATVPDPQKGQTPRSGAIAPAVADMTPIDFLDAKLEGADLRGADLSNAQGLTQSQVNQTKLDAKTKLPPMLYNPKNPLPPAPTLEQLYEYWYGPMGAWVDYGY